MNEQEILEGRLDEDLINNLRKRIGADSNEQTEAAAKASIATLTTALKRNAESPNGFSSLLSALDRDHDGSILDDAAGFIFGKRKADNPKTADGPGILEHIFGRKQTRVAEGIGRGTGLNKSQILQIMISLAPLILGALGKARNKNQSGFGGGSILDILRNTSQLQQSQIQDQGLLSRLLDDDDDNGKDGIFNDLANLGMNAFLSRRK